MGKTLKILFFIILCLSVGIVGSFFTAPAIPTWYAALTKPSFSPPNWLFGPVWSILYILMGISVYLVWQKGVKNNKVKYAIQLFTYQLILNAIWSPIFFGLKNLSLAFVVIVLMWIYILQTIIAFKKVDKKASYLLFPYFAWVSFASVLNFSVWLLNR